MATTDWSDELLASMRTKGDEWADNLIAEIIAKGDAVEAGGGDSALRKLLTQIVTVEQGVPEDLSPDLKTYFLAPDKPDWVDMRMVMTGEKVFAIHGIEIGLILMCASLPACYADAPGVPVLYITTQLTKEVERRIIETTRFVMEVLVPGGLSSSECGALTAKKVRLIHAANRHILRTHPQAHFDEAKWGCPLNQEDLALTLMTFATTVLDSLAKINIFLTTEEEEGYFHAWRYIGHLMGIVPELIPENVADGRAMMQAISKRVYGPSEDGRALTTALVNFLQKLVPGTLFDGIIPVKIRFYVGDEVADMLGVAKADWTKELNSLVKFVHGVEHKLLGDHEMFASISDFLGRKVINGLEDYERKDGRPMFHVPDTLRAQWGLHKKRDELPGEDDTKPR